MIRGLGRQALRLFAAAFVAVLVAGVAAVSPAAATTEGAANFVQRHVDEGVAFLTDKSLSLDQRKARVATLLSSVMDLRRLGLFCLGDAAKTASPAEIAAFDTAFKKFTVAKYSAQLSDYGGQSLKVRNTTERGPGDYVVAADIVDPGDAGGGPAIPVLFRVLQTGENYAIVDASIEGVWFGLAQRDDIRGFLARNGNNVGKLIVRLDAMTADLTGANASAAK